MQYTNEISFLVLALILWGLAIGAKSLLELKAILRPPGYWYLALIFTAASYTFFGIASLTHIWVLILANTCLLAGYIYLGAFFRSLGQPLNRRFGQYIFVALLLIAVVFGYLMLKGTFVARVTFVISIASLCMVWQLVELNRLSKLQIARPTFLIFSVAAELILAISRAVLIFFDDIPSTAHLYQEPLLSMSIRWFWFAFMCLSYVAIIGFQLKKLSEERVRATRENLRISELLIEKEALISSLLKANKTAATGALSASIAHELNQPLGASNLNIQFLQMKLDRDELSPELGAEVLTSLQNDNQRAANIISSLRSVFLEKNPGSELGNINELIETILVIVRPELKSNSISLSLELCEHEDIPMNRGEIQQVILNLLNNAIQALSAIDGVNKTITIRSVVSGGALRVSVIDNGVGVPVDRQPELFELLTSGKKAGMGLGLWLCKHVVTRHDGRIWHETPNGGGATFIMELSMTTQS